MSPEVPEPPELGLKIEVEFLVLKEIIKILPFEFIENLWDL